MHYIVSLDYLVKRAFLVGSGLLNMLPISALPLQIVDSLNSLYGPKSEKKEATVHINPLLGGFFFRRSSLFFCQDLGKIYWQNVAFAGEEKLLEMMLVYIYLYSKS